VELSVDMEEIRHIVPDEAEALMTQEMRYVLPYSRSRRLVDADDLMTLFDQVIAKMGFPESPHRR